MNNFDRNLTMLTDLYELTMANSYFEHNTNKVAVFDVFYRKNPQDAGYSLFCGLTEIIEYIETFKFTKDDILYLKSLNIYSDKFLEYLYHFKFSGNIYSVKEGTIIYPDTPVITVEAPIIEAQIIETMLLLITNHQSLIATKTSRIIKAANNRPVIEMGGRRAHGFDAAVYGAKAAYIAGAQSTATVLAGQKFKIPVTGTMGHSWIQYFNNEYLAFKAFAETYPDNCILLIDTYHVIDSGIVNAIKIHNEILKPLNKRLKAVRIDSGDLAYLSKKVRKILDDNDLADCKIIVSNSVDEFLINSLNSQNAKIDIFGIGERLITSKSDPVFGGVYKLVAIKENDEYIPKIKISETVEKITNPGYKKLYRVYDENNKSKYDIIALSDENVNHNTLLIDENKPWLEYTIKQEYRIELLHTPIFLAGKLVYENPSLEEIRNYCKEQINTLYEEERRYNNPHAHPVDFTKKLYDTKIELLKTHE